MSTETNPPRFDELLPTGNESPAQLEARFQMIGERRKRSREVSAELDRFLIERYAQLLSQHAAITHRFEEICSLQEGLRKLLDQLTTPPWFSGVFLRAADTPIGRLAEVHYGGGRRLVHATEEVSIEELEPGQVVYLGHELNTVLGVAPDGLVEAGEVASVARILDDGRIALRDRDVEMIVQVAGTLAAGSLEPGQSVRWSRELLLALEIVPGGAPAELFLTEYISAQAPPLLGGLSAEIEQVVSLFTQSIARPEMARRYRLDHGNTLLLHGPAGTGKTTLAKIAGAALAEATGAQCRFASIKGAQLESPWVGTTQQNVRELFRELNREPLPTLLFIDEVDAIGRIRGDVAGHHSDKFMSAWLTEIDGLERRRPIGIIASTNRKDLIDQALLQRLSATELFIGRPGLEAAREIFAVHLPPSLPFGPNGVEAERTREEIIEAAVATLYSPNADNAVATLRFRDGTARAITARELVSGRLISQICIEARRAAFAREASGDTPGVGVADMERAVAGAIERLSSTLSIANARSHLSDLPQDLDVVAVEPMRRKIARHRYLHHQSFRARRRASHPRMSS